MMANIFREANAFALAKQEKQLAALESPAAPTPASPSPFDVNSLARQANPDPNPGPEAA